MALRLNPTAEKVASLLEPHVERQGFELVAVEYRKGTRSSLLRLLVDQPGGRIGLNELEGISRVISDLLDVYDPIEGRYTLEVASPGINRPLVKLSHFEAFAGRRVRIRTHQACDGQKSFIGLLAAVTSTGIEVEDEISRRRLRFTFDEISAANYVHVFD